MTTGCTAWGAVTKMPITAGTIAISRGPGLEEGSCDHNAAGTAMPAASKATGRMRLAATTCHVKTALRSVPSTEAKRIAQRATSQRAFLESLWRRTIGRADRRRKD